MKVQALLINNSPILLNTPVNTRNNIFTITLPGTDQTISYNTSYKWPPRSACAVGQNNFTSLRLTGIGLPE